MADYWKSQPRKFCEFCKCWIADNKPSRDFHEKGKKHQEMVQKKLNFVMKKGVKDAKQDAKMAATLKAMEKGALQSVKKDLQANPEMAAQYGLDLQSTELEDLPNPSSSSKKPNQAKQNKKGKNNQPMIGPSPQPSAEGPSPQPKPKKVHVPRPSPNMPSVTQGPAQDPYVGNTSTPGPANDPNIVWKEEWSAQGYPYYWNTLTSETTWEKPEGFTASWEKQQQQQLTPDQTSTDSSLPEVTQSASTDTSTSQGEEGASQQTEQPAPTEGAESTATTATDTAGDVTEKPPSPEAIPVADIPPPSLASDQEAKGDSDSPAQVPEPVVPADIPLPTVHREPCQRRVAEKQWYGAWEKVPLPVKEKPIDLELPVDDNAAKVEVKTISANEPKIKFRQKKVDTLGAEFVAFKKRKINAGKRSIRTTDTEKD